MGKKIFTIVVERKYFTGPSRESNPARWMYRQTLYHVAVKAGFYRKAVKVYYIYLDPVTFTPSNLKLSLNFLVQDSCEMRPREIFMHRTVIGLVICGGRHCPRGKIFYMPQPGIEPRSLDLQVNLLPRCCKSRLLPQGSRSVLYIPRPCDTILHSKILFILSHVG